MEKQRSAPIFNCFICSQPFSSRHTLNKGGKVPLVLECGHSACDSCIARLVNCPGETITCQLCNKISTTSENYNPAKPELEFPLNSIILGQLVLKSQSGWDDNKISFSMPSKMQSSPRAVLCHECVERRAEFNCVQCQVPYCGLCFNKVHQSAKAFMNHVRTDISNVDSANIEIKCPIHQDLNKQFWCEKCSVSVCSNCLISSHNGHNISLLNNKNLECFRDILSAHVNVSNVHIRLKATRKKAMFSLSKQENAACKATENEIREHFSRLHGLLISKENRLLRKLYSPYRGCANSLKTLLQQMDSSIEELDNLLQVSNALIQHDKKYLNNACYPEVLDKLRLKEVTPCHLLISQDTQNTSKFTYDENILKLLDEHCDIDVTNDEPVYRLVTENELPENYQIEPIKSVSLDSIKGMSTFVSILQSESSSTVSPAASMQSIGSVSCTEESPPPPNPIPEPAGNRNFDELVEGCKVSVVLTHAVSPSDFYVRRVGLEKKLNEIKDAFNKIPLTSFKPPMLNRISPGDYLMALFSQDSQWYRSVVLKVEDNFVTVFYIDFGNTENVHRDRLRIMPENLMKYDGMAVHCTLNYCKPARGAWAPQAISTMLKIVENGELYVSIRKRTESLLYVDLMRSDLLDEVNLRQALIFLGYARNTEPSSPSMKVDIMTSQRPLSTSKTFQNGHVMEVDITYFESPFEFYARDLKSTGTLARLSAGLNEMYSRKCERMIVYHPKIGMIVAAMNSSDNQWRRAKVTEVLPDKMVKVTYLDFGNSEIVVFKRLRYLGNKFYKIGVQCFKNSLLDVAPLEGNNSWSGQALSTFALLLRGDPDVTPKLKFRLAVHSYRDDRYYVVLYKEQGNLSLCVNTALVNENVAKSTGSNSTVLHIPSKIPEDTTATQKVCKDRLAANGKSFKTPSAPSEVVLDKATLKTHNESSSQAKKIVPKLPNLELAAFSVSQQSLLSDVTEDREPPFRIEDRSKESSAKEKESIKVPVTIVKVVSPSEFYITPVTMVPKLKLLKGEMQKYYNKRGDSVKLKEISENIVCVIKREEEGDWCRAFIVKVNESTVEVLLPDFGDKLEVSKDSVYILVDKFQDLRDGATRCHLGGLKQPFEDRWPMTSTDEIIEFGEKYEGNIFITKLGQEKENSMPVEVLMKEEKAAGALEPMKVTWISLNNNLKMRGLALADGTIDWDVEDYKYISIQHQIPKLQMDVFKGIPIKCTNITDTSEAEGMDEISNAESIFGSTMRLTDLASEDIDANTSVVESITDEDIIPESVPSITDTVESLTSEEAQRSEVVSPQMPLSTPPPIMPKAWPPHVGFSKMEFIANPTNVNNEASIFIQDFQKSVAMLKRIGDILDSNCRMSLPMPHDMYWSVNQTCITRYHLDQKWYRGVVKAINNDDNSVTVELVDYGNVEECSVNDLRKMPLAADIPVQGQFCRLKKIKPNNSDGKWLIPVLDRMHALLVEKHCLVQLSMDNVDKLYNIESVKLPDGSEVLNYLVKEGCAVYDDSSSTVAPSIMAVDESVLVTNPESTSVIRVTDEDGLCEVLSETTLHDCVAQPPLMPPTSQSLTIINPNWSSWAAECEDYIEATEAADRAVEEERRRQRQQRSLVTSDSESASTSIDHSSFNPCDLYEMNPIFHPQDDSDLEDSRFGYLYLDIPSNLDRFEVEVGILIQGDTVTFQITDSNDLKLSHSREKFLELTSDLQTEAPLQPSIPNPRRNGICCAKFSVDGEWYRGLILEVPDELHVLVKYVDYGNMELLPITEIREMKELWTMVEVQSFEAKLHNIVMTASIDKDWERVKYEMEKALFEQKLTAIIVNREPFLSVELYNGDILAYQSIIDSGLIGIIKY